jgi:hypothetical protein
MPQKKDKKKRPDQAFAWPIYIQEHRYEECGVFYL